tara:strand:+ start:2547 stop:3608 length:1062 start_codon:yes stop_codon:yes gene_type:complete
LIRKKTFIIAEAGINHNGKLSNAHKLIDIAKKSGADAIKFQTFNSKLVSTKFAKLATYQNKIGKFKNQIDMLKHFELPLNSFKELSYHAKDKGLEFMSTAFDEDSLDFLVNEIKIKILKIPSGEINNFSLLAKIKSTNLPIIMSTGASKFEDIISAYNYLSNKKKLINIKSAVNSKRILKKKFIKNLAILHCTSEYPAPLKNLNLRFIQTLKDKFPCKIGYSDHSKSLIVPSIAVTLGASIIEKHFTLNNNLKGPDHQMSLNPNELEEMIKNIRTSEISLGQNKKKISNGELNNKKIIRRFVVAKTIIKKGDFFSKSNITCKRSNNGISASKYFQCIGKKSRFNFNKDESIKC